ncbi:hypothetical protein D3C71_1913040 [compost metagenome]
MAIAGSDKGSTIRNSTPTSLQPSIRAESSRPSGMFWKKFFKTIRLNALMALGIIRAHRELVRCRAFTTK